MMKRYYLAASFCLASAAVFSQTQEKEIREKAKDPKTQELSARADSSLIDKRALTDDTRKKKPKREKSHKECSRMKS